MAAPKGPPSMPEREVQAIRDFAYKTSGIIPTQYQPKAVAVEISSLNAILGRTASKSEVSFYNRTKLHFGKARFAYKDQALKGPVFSPPSLAVLRAELVGKRVQLHPGEDRWMMGDRFGVIVRVLRNGHVRVKLDKSGTVLTRDTKVLGEIF